MNNNKVLMAMSGGIDSAVAAMLLREQGYELVGVTFRVFDSIKESCLTREKGCCSIDSIMEAKKLAQDLGFEHHILDLRETFKQQVIANFVDEYMRGRTPNPCVLCNSTIKWGKLLEAADTLGCARIATGHYAKIVDENGHFYLANAADERKDQTYFLWMLTEDNLRRTLFPLGNYTKQQVREMAAARGFVRLAQKSESQEICFVPDNDYRTFLSQQVADFAERCKKGDFIDKNGTKIGTHEGFPNYTIGQRKGLKVAFGTPKYVTQIDAEQNRVTLGDRDDLLTTTLAAIQCRFTDTEQLHQNPHVLARIRYKSPATPATIAIEENHCHVTFDEAVWGVTPGQSLVLYQDGKVVGGGVIE